MVPDQVVCYSGGGSLLTMLAPGFMITDSSGDVDSGTSVAAPFVAGAVAVLRGTNAYPYDSLAMTAYKMTSTGRLITDKRTNMVFPRLQLDAAIASGVTVSINPPNCRTNPASCR